MKDRGLRFRRLRLQSSRPMTKATKIPTTPPMTPPTMAPIAVCDAGPEEMVGSGLRGILEPFGEAEVALDEELTVLSFPPWLL